MPKAPTVYLLALWLIALEVSAQTPQDAQNIISQARSIIAGQDAQLVGQIRSDKARLPFIMTLRHGIIQVQFENPQKRMTLDVTKSKDTRFKEQSLAKDIPVNSSDLLWSWLRPGPAKLLGTESIRGRPSWKIQPDDKARQTVWIDQQSFAPLKIEEHNSSGQLLKRTELVSGKRLNEIWVPKQIRLETFVPPNSKAQSRSYIEITSSPTSPKTTGKQ
jgi:hypothetical protein